MDVQLLEDVLDVLTHDVRGDEEQPRDVAVRLAAVDVDVVVRSAADVSVAIERLRELGYVYQGDKGIAGRAAFTWPPQAPRHHLYVVVAGNKPHSDHVRFREYLRKHPDVAREYAELKKALANQHADDRERYAEGKADFISRVLAVAEQ